MVQICSRYDDYNEFKKPRNNNSSSSLMTAQSIGNQATPSALQGHAFGHHQSAGTQLQSRSPELPLSLLGRSLQQATPMSKTTVVARPLAQLNCQLQTLEGSRSAFGHHRFRNPSNFRSFTFLIGASRLKHYAMQYVLQTFLLVLLYCLASPLQRLLGAKLQL